MLEFGYRARSHSRSNFSIGGRLPPPLLPALQVHLPLLLNPIDGQSFQALLQGQMPVAENPFLMLLGERAFFNVRETHWVRVYFVVGGSRFLEVQKSLYSQKRCLNALKAETSRGWRACEVWERRVSKSSPTLFASSTTSNVTWLLWLSRINKCWWSGAMPLTRFTDLRK